MKKLIFMLISLLSAAFISIFAFSYSNQITNEAPLPTAVRKLPERMFGLTIDSVRDVDTIISQLQKFKSESKDGNLPVMRIVFDVAGDGNPLTVPSEYKKAIKKIKGQTAGESLAFVMASVFDSQAVYTCRNQPVSLADCYEQRTAKFYEQLKDDDGTDLVDLWEIGNEVNGEWVGWQEDEKTGWKEWRDKKITVKDMLARRDEVAEAVARSYRFIKEKGKPTVLTLYLNQDTDNNKSWEELEKKADEKSREKIPYGENFGMFKWWDAYKKKFPEVDYVFISYWQDDNFEVLPAEWKKIFELINADVPAAKLGFGEVGAQCYYKPKEKNDCESDPQRKACQAKPDGQKIIDYQYRRCPCCLKMQPVYIDRYYSQWDAQIRQMISPAVREKFVGGYFYWHFNDDVLNKITNAADSKTKQTERTALTAEADLTLKLLLSRYCQWQGNLCSAER